MPVWQSVTFRFHLAEAVLGYYLVRGGVVARIHCHHGPEEVTDRELTGMTLLRVEV